MAIQTITYNNKVDLNTTSVADINKVKASDLNEIKSVVNNNATEITNIQNKMCKTLWTGSFTNGTIAVPEISNYTLIAIYVDNVMMLGNQYYGGNSLVAYAQLTTATYAYRYTYSATNETLTTDSNNRGATNGSTNLTITKIVGII